MSLLRLRCTTCGRTFESGVPLRREHLDGVKLRALEVCPACGAAGEYGAADYRDEGSDEGDPPSGGEFPPAR